MSTWLDIVKKHAKANKGKSLKEYLPDAKKEYDMLKKTGKIIVSTVTPKSKTRTSGKTRKSRSKTGGATGDDIAVDEITMEEAEVVSSGGGRRKRSTRRTAKRRTSRSRSRSRSTRRSRSRSQSRSKKGGSVYSPAEYNNTQEQNAPRQDDAVIMQQQGGKRRRPKHRKH